MALDTRDTREFCAEIQKRCLPGVWSKGVLLSRSESWVEDRFTPEEIIYRLTVPERTVGLKISLWPADQDAHCTCGDRNEICAHIAAASIILKSGKRFLRESSGAVTEVRYSFVLDSESLRLERQLVRNGKSEPLRESLVAVAGAISSGRYAWPPLAATPEDYRVDELVSKVNRNSGQWGEADQVHLLKALSSSGTVSLLDRLCVPEQSQMIRTSPEVWAPTLAVAKIGDEFEIKAEYANSGFRAFPQGLALVQGVLRPHRSASFTAARIAKADLRKWVTEIIPELEKKFRVNVLAKEFPQASPGAPRIEVDVLPLGQEANGEESVGIVPRIRYPSDFAIRDLEQEKKLEQDLKSEHFLALDRLTKLSGIEAVKKVSALKRAGLLVGGNQGVNAQAIPRFSISGDLQPQVEFFEQKLGWRFHCGGGYADPNAVMRAWRENASLVPLIGGGWANLPRDWLEKYGEQIEGIWSAQSLNQGRLPPARIPEMLQIARDLNQESDLPQRLQKLARYLSHPQEIGALPLPPAVQATLRGYQRVGVNWLLTLREAGLGAMLADDMGLGKTLQAICAIRGKALVVAPASVLANWKKEIHRFRPDLSVYLYWGADRDRAELDQPRESVFLTTYGVLRADGDQFAGLVWDTVILDESQNIKNQESKAARAAHRLQSHFKIALTGTPVENRVADLESQFRFLNPSLLPEEGLSVPEIRKRIRPFILRRLKTEVAPELPLRTDITLEAEFSEDEKLFYQSLLASSRAEVQHALRDGQGKVSLRILELLLRLRQACCDAALVPGGGEQFASRVSSKVQLLLESLEQSLSLGHRALVFSQWTSLLDRIESRFKERGLSFSRIDGNTRDRQEVVDAFQRSDGPSVMLLSLKAGGVGLTLTAADHVYILDPWWNPAVEQQAADRVHRIGQTQPVFIHRLIAKDTVEERIAGLKQEKLAMAAALLEEEKTDGLTSLSAEDILGLLS